MTIDEMYTLLKKTKYPVAYRVFKTEQNPPFIVFYTDGSENEFADNVVYKKKLDWSIDLVTDIKDPAAEAKVESYLTHWEKSEVYDSDEKIFIITYTFTDIE